MSFTSLRLRNAVSLTFAAALATAFAVAACGESDPPASTPSADASSTPDAATSTDSATASDSATGTDSAASSDAPADAGSQEALICNALASRSACPGGALPCEEDAKCIYGRLMLPAAAQSYATCRSAPSCKGDDRCVAEAGLAVGGAAATKYVQDCSARRTACNGGFADDYCAPAFFAFDGAGPGAQACLVKACGEIQACIMDLKALKDIAACK